MTFRVPNMILCLKLHFRLSTHHVHWYTSPGDVVLCTAGERDDLSNLVLESDKVYASFITDESEVEDIRSGVNIASVAAIRQR